jgi:hypothetical protein
LFIAAEQVEELGQLLTQYDIALSVSCLQNYDQEISPGSLVPTGTNIITHSYHWIDTPDG